MSESALDGMKSPPDVIVCANDDMALGALQALKARNLLGKVKLIGFDALPEALAQIRDGNMTATIEQSPGGQSKLALDTLVEFHAHGRQAGPGRHVADAGCDHQRQPQQGGASQRGQMIVDGIDAACLQPGD